MSAVLPILLKVVWIRNANTIIINDAQHFGLSDLHQLRDEWGALTRKHFASLTPPMSTLTIEARNVKDD